LGRTISQADTVIEHVQSQEDHHRKVTFQDEFRRFLESSPFLPELLMGDEPGSVERGLAVRRKTPWVVAADCKSALVRL
jgi:hypothetical protein